MRSEIPISLPRPRSDHEQDQPDRGLQRRRPARRPRVALAGERRGGLLGAAGLDLERVVGLEPRRHRERGDREHHGAHHQDGALEPRQHAVAEQDRHRDHRAEQHRDLAADDPAVDRRRRDQRGDPEDQADVGGARADHDPQRDPLVVGERRLGRDGELGGRGAVRDHGQPDDQRLDAERPRDLRRAADQPLRSPVQDRDPGDQAQRVERRRQRR
jgi:hypothetical protein